jgi:hypothetical protein
MQQSEAGKPADSMSSDRDAYAGALCILEGIPQSISRTAIRGLSSAWLLILGP